MIGKRIRQIREHVGKGRQAFSKELGIPKQTLINVETKDSNFGVNIARKVCELYPQYTLWLMTGNTASKTGQIIPLKYPEAQIHELPAVADKDNAEGSW